MSDVLARKCSVADCKSVILGEQEINLVDPPPRDFRPGIDHGHLQLCYARDLVFDLGTAALAAGWQWDGSEWLCDACQRTKWREVVDAAKLERLAKSMNL